VHHRTPQTLFVTLNIHCFRTIPSDQPFSVSHSSNSIQSRANGSADAANDPERLVPAPTGAEQIWGASLTWYNPPRPLSAVYRLAAQLPE